MASSTEMAMVSLIALVLSSSVIAALIGSLVTWRINHQNYRNDYYKKLLDKRLDAYEQVEVVLMQLKGFTVLDDGSACPIMCYAGRIAFARFISSIGSAVEKSFWLSDRVGIKLTEKSTFLVREIDNYIDENKDYDTQLKMLGAQHADGLRQLRQDLECLMLADLKTLDDIPLFIKSIRVNKAFPVPAKESHLQISPKRNTNS